MAADYQAPVKDMRFVLDTVVDLDRIGELDGFETASRDTVDQILDEAAKFAGTVLAPINHDGDRQGARLVNGVVRMPDGFADCYRQYVDAGWGSVTASPDHGGMGLPWSLNVALNEMWQAANMSLADGWMLTQGAIEALEAHGSAEQKAIYLPKLVTGEWSGTMNLTESGAGSDVGALRTKAEPDNGSWRITGTKIFITHGDQDMSDNVIHLVLARTPGAPPGTKGISLFLVPKRLVDDDGRLGPHNDLRVVSLEHKLGHLASPTAMMSYGDDGGALGGLIGGENQGMACMFTMMNNARLNVAVQGLSIADRAYQAARHWARERIQGTDIGGRGHEPVPIIRHPDVRRMLMDMKSHTEAMRALCYSAAAAVDLARHHPDPMMRARHHGYLELITPVAKAWCTDQGFEMASLGVQVHGGMGYIEEAGAAQYLRDARITMIYEGTNGIQALDLVRRKLRQDGGQAAGRLIADMRATVAALGAERGGALAAIRDRLAPAVDALDQATNWIRDTFADDPVAGAAAATPYCRMMGFTVGGWLLAQGARAAAARLAVANGDTGFHEAKIQTARYFAEQHLPPAAALLGPITHAREIVMAVAEDQL